MAKKHHRKEHISVRRKREAAIKEKNRKHLTKKQNILLWSVIGVLALALVVFSALREPGDTLFPPKDALVTWRGLPRNVSENGMVAEIDGQYYEVGTWTAPEGYTFMPDYDIKTDDNQFEAYYENNDPLAQPLNVYVSVVPEKTVEEMRTNSMSINPDIGEIQQFDGGKYPYRYFVQPIQNDSDTSLKQHMIAGYVQTNYDCMILLNLTSGYFVEDELPTVEDMLAGLPAVMEGLELK